jgi:N-acetylmuramoyl-L-alanine amidase
MSTNQLRTEAETFLLARLIYGEARGEPIEGQVAVACVARNRVLHPKIRWWGVGYRDVILKPFQFSCFNEADPNFPKLINAHLLRDWVQWLWIAKGVIDGVLRDNTKGATHYANLSVVSPHWAAEMRQTAKIGGHTFFGQ